MSSVKWFVTRFENGREEIFDPVRKKYVSLTPEEAVRQQMIHYLVENRKFPLGLIAVEYAMRINQMQKRCDILVFSRKGFPLMIIECKAKHIGLSQETIEQAAMYNLRLNVQFLTITNGTKTYCCRLFAGRNDFQLLPQIPDYTALSEMAAEI